jgi:hypothetical protein
MPLVTAGRRETIDFNRVTDIRHTLVMDPAAGLARIAGHGGREPLPRLPLAILAGTEDAICGEQSCTDRRAFALSDSGKLDLARSAAAAFQREVCPPHVGASP